MRGAVAAYNRELERDGLPSISVGIGLQRGSGLAGLVGSRDLKAFTFMGRTVNVAVRVQELTRQYAADIILTDSLRRTSDPRFSLHPLPPTRVKGVAEPISIYAVDGFA